MADTSHDGWPSILLAFSSLSPWGWSSIPTSKNQAALEVHHLQISWRNSCGVSYDLCLNHAAVGCPLPILELHRTCSYCNREGSAARVRDLEAVGITRDALNVCLQMQSLELISRNRKDFCTYCSLVYPLAVPTLQKLISFFSLLTTVNCHLECLNSQPWVDGLRIAKHGVYAGTCRFWLVVVMFYPTSHVARAFSFSMNSQFLVHYAHMVGICNARIAETKPAIIDGSNSDYPLHAKW